MMLWMKVDLGQVYRVAIVIDERIVVSGRWSLMMIYSSLLVSSKAAGPLRQRRT